MRARIENLVNGPFDLEGGVVLPAMGSVTADFRPEYIEILQAAGAVRVEVLTETPAVASKTRKRRVKKP